MKEFLYYLIHLLANAFMFAYVMFDKALDKESVNGLIGVCTGAIALVCFSQCIHIIIIESKRQ